jgi:oxygen-independent coproporphyrinogen-3 oxidase
LGGGTPSYLAPQLLESLCRGILDRFEPAADMEFSIELDPRVTTPEHLDVLQALGVNRVSVGVQDLDRDVQSLIGRIQPHEQTKALIDGCRARGVEEINIDLVYGLPGQSTQSLLKTAESVVELGPDRLALYGYAHVPWIRGNQKSIDESRLPDSDARLDMFMATRDYLEDHGYLAIGLDHFARPHDSLARADSDGTLMRNFMGYTVKAGTDLLGLGVTSIGDVDGALVQNTMKLSRYHAALKEGRLPTERGLERSAPDRVRGRVISDLMCRHRVNKSEIEQAFGVEFDQYFVDERERLIDMQLDGLVVETPTAVELTELGRPFVRNVAMVFDAYCGPKAQPKQHSSTV